MHYYHDMKKAESYAAMCDGYDAAAQLKMLYKVLPAGAPVLELGSGPGNDLELLASHYRVSGSDYSSAFIKILKARFPDLPILPLDAITIPGTETFDAIYSNKVLHHLNDDELAASFHRQNELLKPGGYVFHLIWQQLEPPKEDLGLVFKPRDTATMTASMGSAFEVLEVQEFSEFENGDSLAILARKK